MAEASPIALDELQPGDELLQSSLWGRFKARFGWRAQPLRWKAAGDGGTLLVLTRSTPFGPLAYVPGAPPYPPSAPAAAGRMLGDLAPVVTLQGAVLGDRPRVPRPTVVRYDLPWPVADGSSPPSVGGNLYRAPVNVQPTSTVLVRLREEEDRLLARMKSKTRYNIRLARRRGVAVTVATATQALEEPLAGWYRLYRSTAERHRITAHNAAYFTTLFQLAAAVDTPELYLLSAHYRDELVGGIVVSVCGHMARYLYGASAPRQREAMANYALQWAAMQLARERGCRSYDLYGIPPAADPEHPWFGLYRFKTGFGGDIVHRWGCWDYAMRPLPYRLLRCAELLRTRYYGHLRPRLLRAVRTAAGNARG